jgi:transposase-like protein
MEGLTLRKDQIMASGKKYPDELRSRAVRLVLEAREQEPETSMTKLYQRIGGRVGVAPDTLRAWVKQKRIDTGEVQGTTSTDAAKIKRLEHEVAELKRANEILLAASSFFARELDPRLPW